jgi:hypothetical protein
MQMRWLVIPMAAALVVVSGCGGGDDLSDAVPSADSTALPDSFQPDDPDQPADLTAGGQGDTEVIPEPSGPVELNTIRIGSEVWERTLPMTTGQCFLYEDDGTLPTSGNVWGTLNGDEDTRFSANYGQDGTFESEDSNNQDVYWIAGERSPGADDLTIELDFDNLMISGSGSFTSLTTGATASGSFQFQCDPADQ